MIHGESMATAWVYANRGCKNSTDVSKILFIIESFHFFENGDRAFSESIHQRRVSYLQLT